MRTNSLKYQVLEWLFENYLEQPNSYHNINDFLEQKGITSESSMMSFGYALKAAGFLKEASTCKSDGAFMACISVNGIDFVSTAIKNETRHLIRYAIDANTEDFLPLNDQLKLLPGNTTYALDISRYLKENGLAQVKFENETAYFKILDLAYLIFNSRPAKWERGDDAIRKLG